MGGPYLHRGTSFDYDANPTSEFASLKNLRINKRAIFIVDVEMLTGTEVVDEEIEEGEVEVSDAVATLLWSWQPNALKALLDHERFSNFKWTMSCPKVQQAPDRIVICRDLRQIKVGKADPGIAKPILTINLRYNIGAWKTALIIAGKCGTQSSVMVNGPFKSIPHQILRCTFRDCQTCQSRKNSV